MKKLLLLSLTCIILLSFQTLEIRKQMYDNGQLKYQVEVESGLLNGKYMSWYRNGQKKAEGTFKNNQRIGNWSAYDSLRQIQMVSKDYKPITNCITK